MAINKMIGERVKMLRFLRKLTLEQFASEIGVTYQQVQKYESGANKISAARLGDIAHFFNVPEQFFYDGLTPAARHSGMSDNDQSPFESGDVAPEMAKLVLGYKSLPEDQRKKVAEYIESLASKKLKKS